MRGEYLRTVPTRRQLLLGGLAAAGALAAGDVLYDFSTGDDRAIVSAIAPVMLGVDAPAQQVVNGFDVAVSGLPLAVQAEVHQLLGLLRFPLTRMFVAGVWHPWHAAGREEIAAFLERFRYSNIEQLRSAYDALHQLIMAAWYGNTQSWTAIGYAGPPSLSS